LGDVQDEMKIAQEEIFGPVVCLLKTRNLDEAISRANRKEKGTQAWVFTGSFDKALYLADALNYEGLTVNQTRIKSRNLDTRKMIQELII
jgi:acyl-CoA reductase-like NAD-dependent aldehyde dehydrogenase